MFANNESSKIKRTLTEKERQQNEKLRETLNNINLQAINEDDQFEVTPQNFTE